MGASNSKRRKKERQKRKKRIVQASSPRSAIAVYHELSRVFGDSSPEMLRLAMDGASADEISQRLGIPREKTQRFIDRFVGLPEGYGELLLRAPSLLNKQSQMQSMVRAAIKTASRR